MDEIGNGFFCLHCGIPLEGRQTKFCKPAHRQAYNRAKKKNAQTDAQTGNTPPEQKAVLELGKLRTELAESRAIAAVIAEERDRSNVRVERLTHELANAMNERSELKGRLAETQKKDRLLYGGLLVLLIAIIVMAIILVLSI